MPPVEKGQGSGTSRSSYVDPHAQSEPTDDIPEVDLTTQTSEGGSDSPAMDRPTGAAATPASGDPSLRPSDVLKVAECTPQPKQVGINDMAGDQRFAKASTVGQSQKRKRSAPNAVDRLRVGANKPPPVLEVGGSPAARDNSVASTLLSSSYTMPASVAQSTDPTSSPPRSAEPIPPTRGCGGGSSDWYASTKEHIPAPRPVRYPSLPFSLPCGTLVYRSTSFEDPTSSYEAVHAMLVKRQGNRLPVRPLDLFMEQSLHCVRLMNVGFAACIQHMKSERELDFAAQKIAFVNDVTFQQSIDYAELEKKVAALKEDADRAISLDQKLSCVTQEKERLTLEGDIWKGKHSSLEEEMASVDLEFGRLRKESAGKEADLVHQLREKEALIKDAMDRGVDVFFESEEYIDRVGKDTAIILAEFIAGHKAHLPGLEEQFEVFKSQYPSIWPSSSAPGDVSPDAVGLVPSIGVGDGQT